MIVYAHINISTKLPFYIGVGKDEGRANNFFSRKKYWKKYVEMYGYPKVEILHNNLTVEEASALEIVYIKKYGTIKNGGLLINKTRGGEIHPKYKMKNPKAIDLKISKSLKEKYSNGYVSKHLGLVRSDLTKRKIAISKIGVKQSTKSIFKRKIFLQNKENNNKTKWIVHKENGIFYLGVQEAANSVGITYNRMKFMLQGKTRNITQLMYC